ncbi:MAG: hypothetical protein AB1566_10640 [Chloroflexota bacterium]
MLLALGASDEAEAVPGEPKEKGPSFPPKRAPRPREKPPTRPTGAQMSGETRTGSGDRLEFEEHYRLCCFGVITPGTFRQREAEAPTASFNESEAQVLPPPALLKEHITPPGTAVGRLAWWAFAGRPAQHPAGQLVTFLVFLPFALARDLVNLGRRRFQCPAR